MGSEGAAEPHSSVQPGAGGGQGAAPQAGWPDPEPRAGGPGCPEEVLGGYAKTSGSQEAPGRISCTGGCSHMFWMSCAQTHLATGSVENMMKC